MNLKRVIQKDRNREKYQESKYRKKMEIEKQRKTEIEEEKIREKSEIRDWGPLNINNINRLCNNPYFQKCKSECHSHK